MLIFVVGDVRTQLGAGPPAALEFVGGAITSTSFGEIALDLGGGQRLEGDDRHPRTDPGVVEALRPINPWVEQADLDHHGYGLVRATPDDLDVTLKRLRTIKRSSRATLPEAGYRWRVARGQTTLSGT